MKHFKRFFVYLIFTFLSLQTFAGEMLYPRKVFAVNTNFFTILFPDSCKQTAKVIYEKADDFYLIAKKTMDLQEDFHTTVVISPDSEEISVKFSTSPISQIVIFDGESDDFSYSAIDIILSKFNHEITKAVALKSGRIEIIRTLRIPSSFIEGLANINQKQNFEINLENHKNQQLILLAKLENKIPSFFQSTAFRDIYPYNELEIAFATEFFRFLIQKFGFIKFIEFLDKCSDLNPKPTSFIFKSVFGSFPTKLWKQFTSSITLPKDYEKMEEIEKLTNQVLKFEEEGFCDDIVNTKYGIVWFDSVRKEIDLLNTKKNTQFRKMLFLASDVTKISSSPDGRYLLVSYKNSFIRKDFIKHYTKIYDLQKRKFLPNQYDLSEASFILLDNDEFGIVGVAQKDEINQIQIFPFITTKMEILRPLYTKKFLENENAFSPVYAGKNNIFYLVTQNKGENKIIKYNYKTQQINTFSIQNEQTKIAIQNIRYDFLTNSINHNYFFEYFINEQTIFQRMGFFECDNEFTIKNVVLQNTDIYGGVNSPLLLDDEFYFSSKRIVNHKIKTIKKSDLPFKNATIIQDDFLETDFINSSLQNDYFDTQKIDFFDESILRKYNPFKYMIGGSVRPLFAISSLDFPEPVSLNPSLGFTFTTKTDPFDNTKIRLSASYLTPELSFDLLKSDPNINFYERLKQNSVSNKNHVAALVLENSSTPVDIVGGILFRCNNNGEYDFEGKIGGKINIPLFMNFRILTISLYEAFKVSTDFYDSSKMNKNPSLTNWPIFFDSYYTTSSQIVIKYSDVHQHGISKYEQRGIVFGGKLYSLIDENYSPKKETDDSYNGTLSSFGLFASIAFPRLSPFKMKNSFIFSLPSKIEFEFFNTLGTAFRIKTETLLIGSEFQNGNGPLLLFFSRLGIKAGYDLKFIYQTDSSLLPRLTDGIEISRFFHNSIFQDIIYLTFDTDFIIPLGFLSDKQFNLKLTAEFFLQKKNYNISLNFKTLF